MKYNKTLINDANAQGNKMRFYISISS